MIIDLCRNPTSTYFFDNFAWQDHFLYDTHVLIVRLIGIFFHIIL